MDKLECLNETEEDSVKKIFLPWENRLQKVRHPFGISGGQTFVQTFILDYDLVKDSCCVEGNF